MEDKCDHSEVLYLTVPLFPLPNVVLFPRAVLPLHIFEDRYKTMTARALSGDRRIAMALLKPGWERCYHQKPEIESVVCVGRILSSERLSDGKYNFLLQGELRAKIVREIPSNAPYRTALLEPLCPTAPFEIDLTNQRQRLVEMFCSGPLEETAVGCQLKQILLSPLCTSDAADLIAFNFLDNVALKQSLLAEPDASRRLQRLISTLEIALPMLEATQRAAHSYTNN
jgi:Lon protease-like protein